MKILMCVLTLLASSPAFAINENAKAEAKSILALAMPGSEAQLTCDFQLPPEHAAANRAQLIETRGEHGPVTVAYFKSVSGAGTWQTVNVRIYPGDAIADLRLKLTEVGKEIGAGSFRMRECY